MPDPAQGLYERRFAERLAATGCRLRHDKVAVRLVECVRAGLADVTSNPKLIVFAVTAPIKRPAKTIEALVRLLVDVPAQGLRTTVHGNMVNARVLTRVSNDGTAVLGFVHNPDYEGGRLLDLAALVLKDADISAISG